jgi:hypothetical protein
MTISNKFSNLMASSGVSLDTLGIRDIGLSRGNALRAVEILRHENLHSRGDVYIRRGDRLEVAHANWYADPKPDESREAYLHRSWDKAETYIKSFPEVADTEVLFAIVVEKAPGADIRPTARLKD